MTYNPEIPLPNDILSDSQGDLLTNFQQLNTVFSKDHVAFDAASNRGDHNTVTFLSQAADPSTMSDEYAIYAKAEGADTELYMRGSQNSTVTQMTRNNELFTHVYPVFAINMDNTDLANPIPAGSASIFSSYNLNTVSGVTRRNGNFANFRMNFQNQVLDENGVATDNYMWSASCFDSSSNPAIAQVENGPYGSHVTSTYIDIICTNQNYGTVLTNITRLVVVCWKFQ